MAVAEHGVAGVSVLTKHPGGPPSRLCSSVFLLQYGVGLCPASNPESEKPHQLNKWKLAVSVN